MAGSFTDLAEKYILDNLFGQNTTACGTGSLATLYVGLLESTADILSSLDTITALTTGECAGSTYARKSFTNSSDTWCNTTAGGGIKQLKAAVTITTAAGSDWGTIGGFAIYNSDSTSAGWALVSSTCAVKVINSGDPVVLTTDLTITLG